MSSIYYLDVEDALVVARDACGQQVDVRDFGLLASALGRPAASMFGHEVYPDLFEKAAALLQSLARNHALVDGNKRLAWGAAWTFLDVNGEHLDDRFDVDAAEKLVHAVIRGDIDEVPEIAVALRAFAARQGG